MRNGRWLAASAPPTSSTGAPSRAGSRASRGHPNHGHPSPRGENTMTTIRRASLAVLAILVLEYGIGVYVSLYATVPRADHGAGLATAIARGPAALSTHAVLGLLLGLGTIAVLVQAIRTRRPAVIATSAF